MALLKIYQFPDPVLARKALPIAGITPELVRLADQMLETMYEAPGIGLAANQVGVLQRILVLDVDYHLEEDEGIGGLDGSSAKKGESALYQTPSGSKLYHRKPRVIINPEILYQEGKIRFPEACLSVPEYSAEVVRAEKIKLQYQDIDGVLRQISADGLLAVAIQHEMDHLEGRLFIDRLSPLKKEMAKKRLIQDRSRREEQARSSCSRTSGHSRSSE